MRRRAHAARSTGRPPGRSSRRTPSCSSASAACRSRTRPSARAASAATASASTSRTAAERGAEFVLFSPLRDDLARVRQRRMARARPGHGRRGHARAWRTRSSPRACTTAPSSIATASGFDRFERYVLGRDDGMPEDARVGGRAVRGAGGDAPRSSRGAWPRRRTLITVSWSLQRAEHGEQPPWMGADPGRACSARSACRAAGSATATARWRDVGAAPLRFGFPTLAAGRATRSSAFIPVARIADMLLHPGEPFDYDGQRLTLPRRPARLLGRRQPVPPPPGPQPPAPRARRGRTPIVVHEPFWTRDGAPRRHRAAGHDVARAQRHRRGGNDAYLDRHAAGRSRPTREARNDYDIFADLADGARRRASVHRGPTIGDGLATPPLRRAGARGCQPLASTSPDFDEFWAGRRRCELPATPTTTRSLFAGVPRRSRGPRRCGRRAAGSRSSRRRSTASATTTVPATRPGSSRPSGSAPPRAARFPLQLIANNPRTRLHSQLDVGAHSQASQGAGPRADPHAPRRRGRARASPTATWCASSTTAAAAWPARCSTDAVRRGVVQLSTGAWYDPLDPADPGADVRPRQPERAHRSTAARRSWPRAAPASTRSSRSSAGRTRFPRSPSSIRRR